MNSRSTTFLHGSSPLPISYTTSYRLWLRATWATDMPLSQASSRRHVLFASTVSGSAPYAVFASKG